MSEHSATIRWQRESLDFTYDSYNRAHRWQFDAGVEVAASAAPEFRGDPQRVDPEEAFVASVASCHMLTFLALAARKRYVVDRYSDNAIGFMEKNDQGRLAITRVALRPEITFAEGAGPSPEGLDKLHQLSHKECFIANSVRTVITVEPPSSRHADK